MAMSYGGGRGSQEGVEGGGVGKAFLGKPGGG